MADPNHSYQCPTVRKILTMIEKKYANSRKKYFKKRNSLVLK
jgi:hypothetical protein